MEEVVTKQSKIEINVGLNSNNLPLEMHCCGIQKKTIP